ncbi:GFA family protein [Stenotrophomonas sp. Iso1]|uniref:GFA family protein n=1 Tax=Stenotrophomonas sp. Iso1 TaxID=2977283 RepID=UPI0022B79AA7|nr:GFA family protein [Stenotrophomonas sp. Iso1]
MIPRIALCSCGQLVAHVVGDPVRVSICHCFACQRRVGGPFSHQARFLRTNVSVSGVSSEHVLVGDEGPGARFHFCPNCGSTVYYEPLAIPDYISIPVGAFTDPTFSPPTVSVYEKRMHSWVMLPAGVEHIP